MLICVSGRANASPFDQPIDMEKVTRVCRQARIWDDIARMPMGLHTRVMIAHRQDTLDLADRVIEFERL